MAEYIITTKAEADDVREALGRAYASTLGKAWPIPPDVRGPGRTVSGETLYYADPLDSADELEVAFKIDDDLAVELGKQVAITDGSKVDLPPTREPLDDAWFKEAPKGAGDDRI